jgi:hypothetical protein
VQSPDDGHFVPIGSDGWFPRGGIRARFDQQPVEAYAMIDACVAAYRTTHDPRWQKSAERAFDWFLGRNDLSLPVCDFRSGGCHDGLHSDRLNQNQGAESTLSWMLSLLLMVDLQEEQASERRAAEQAPEVPPCEKAHKPRSRGAAIED